MSQFSPSSMGYLPAFSAVGPCAAPASSGVAAPRSWPARIGILNDYVRIPYANGSSFASQFLYREFRRRDHFVTVIGPSDPEARAAELPKDHICFSSLPLRNHPGLHLALPSKAGLKKLCDANLDVVVAQTGSALLEAGLWLRQQRRVPLIAVNTIHLPSLYQVLFPDALLHTRVRSLFHDHVMPTLEQQTVDAYNGCDGLVVLAEGLKRYWRERGVTVPISVIPRAIEPAVFDQVPTVDPFPVGATKGARLLAICRLTREKGVLDLIDVFAKYVAEASQEATLTLVGDGPEFQAYRTLVRVLGLEHRIFFMGEQPLQAIPGFLRHADLFVYASLSETYGQVISEAQWCGLPVVALADGMGVSSQLEDDVTGALVEPAGERGQTLWRLAKRTISLLRDAPARERLRRAALAAVQQRSSPASCIESYYEACALARRHLDDHRSSEGERRLLAQRSLANWRRLHLTLAFVGLLRPPATLNRNGIKAPTWDPNVNLSRGALDAQPAAAAPG